MNAFLKLTDSETNKTIYVSVNSIEYFGSHCDGFGSQSAVCISERNGSFYKVTETPENIAESLQIIHVKESTEDEHFETTAE